MKHLFSRLRGLAGWLGLITLGISLTMCGANAGAFCDAKCDCQGCSDSKYDDCLEDFDEDERRADRNGCLDVFDEWAFCVSSEDACRGTDYDDGCKTEKKRWRNCIDDD